MEDDPNQFDALAKQQSKLGGWGESSFATAFAALALSTSRYYFKPGQPISKIYHEYQLRVKPKKRLLSRRQFTRLLLLGAAGGTSAVAEIASRPLGLLKWLWVNVNRIRT